MRGASALEQFLDTHPQPGARVFVIWEPVLDTDWAEPGIAVRSRLNDPRVQQFWDKQRVLSAAFGGPEHLGRLAQVREIRFGMDSVIWDAVAVYPPGTRWIENPPVARFLGAPVVDVAPQLAPYFVTPK